MPMPRRAIFSTLMLLIGTLSGHAAPLNPAARNTALQPRSTLSAKVLRPAQHRILGREQRRADLKVQRITPVWRTPAKIQVGRSAFTQPDGAAVRPAVTQAAGGG